MPGRDCPVHLTHAAPFDVQPNQLVFYDVIELGTAARSGVLSTIADAGGEARLPDAITLSEFKRWITFVEGHHDDTTEESFLNLCTVVKVAGALDDKAIDKWIHLAALRLLQHAFSPGSKTNIPHIEDSLSLLTEGAQHRVFSAAAASGPRCLYSLLDFLPSQYHTAVVAASITPTKTLHVPFNMQSLHALNLVAALPASPASVLSLHSHDYESKTYDQPPGEIHIAKNVVQVLQHHTSMTSLSISSCYITAISARLLFPAIATLTSLHTLHLGARQTYFPPESLTMLQQALPSLPHLEDLRMMLLGFPVTLKRPREPEAAAAAAAAAAAPVPFCLATALSRATGLTSLHIAISGQINTSLYTAATPAASPRLRQLTVASGCNKWELPPALLSLLRVQPSAPLTSLTLQTDDGYSTALHLPLSTAAGAQRLLDSLAEFSQLRCLRAVLPVDNRDSDGHDNGVYDVMLSRTPAVLAALTLLQELSIAAESPVLCRAVPALAAELSALTCLELEFVAAEHLVNVHDLPWSDVCSSLCQLNLTQLHVSADQFGSEAPGLAALSGLTQLSALWVHGWDCLWTPADCEALAGMTTLQTLALVNCYCMDAPRSAVRAVLALSALTSLTVWIASEEFDDALRYELRSRAAAAAWPALQELSLRLDDPWGIAEEAVQWAGGLPALKKLAVTLPPAEWEVSEEEYDDDEYCDVGKVCERIAAEAAVQLSRIWLPDDE